MNEKYPSQRLKFLMAMSVAMLGTIATFIPLISKHSSTGPAIEWTPLMIWSIVGAIGLFIVLGLCVWVLDIEQLQDVARALVFGIPCFCFYAFSAVLFLASFAALIVFLLFPEIIVTPDASVTAADVKHLPKHIEVQIIGAICSAGLLGGFVNQLHTRFAKLLSPKSDGLLLHHSTWSMLFSLFSSLFISLVFFLLLRAGILKTVEIDTFNVYGVTGCACLTGYFADSIIARFRGIYEQLLGGTTTKKEDETPI